MTTTTARPEDERRKMRVECRECHFRETVPVAGETTPADTVVDHGMATGHILSVSHVEE